MKYTVCLLCYGQTDLPAALAQRLTASLTASLQDAASRQHVAEVRIACTFVGGRTKQIVTDFARGLRERWDLGTLVWWIPQPHVKYPIMRRMFYDPPLQTRLVMWFDDDTFICRPSSEIWWRPAQFIANGAALVGQYSWRIALDGKQWEWVQQQPWYNPAVGPPPATLRGKPAFKFVQGAWWVADVEVLRKYDWPIPELAHNGGDSMLCEVLRHGGHAIAHFDAGLAINADLETATHSKSPARRAHSRRVGWSGRVSQDRGHHEITYELERW